MKGTKMSSVSIYLNFKGNTEEAFNFYKSVFGGDFISLQRFRDTPEAGKVAEKDRDKIMHVALPILNGYLLMATDTLESMGQKLTVGNNFSIVLNVDSEQEVNRLFDLLSSGGKAQVKPENTFWGAYFGMTTDRFGIQWMLSYDSNRPQ
ncbi:MAG TPA: VOC family protein [Ignavibacteriales bacterium]|nr:VOC family protein [Ignavibacteriales bacterium]